MLPTPLESTEPPQLLSQLLLVPMLVLEDMLPTLQELSMLLSVRLKPMLIPLGTPTLATAMSPQFIMLSPMLPQSTTLLFLTLPLFTMLSPMPPLFTMLFLHMLPQ